MKITEEHKQVIKAVFGKQFAIKVANHLTQKEIFNRKNEPYTSAAIKNIFYRSEGDEVLVNELLNHSISTLENQRLNLKKAKEKARKLLN